MPKSKGLPLCGRRCRRTGEPCKNRVVDGMPTCRMHGSGGRARVRDGRRKPSGRPVVHGKYSDPDRTRYGNLGELIQRCREDPGLMYAANELAVMKAALQQKVDEIKEGSFSVMKSENFPADPMSWLIEDSGAVIDRIARVNGMFRPQ